ncbi:MAG: hypothetical protein DLM55_03420 [Acidimicrobiales bacterium]|nr:MAG: hypothetical protein DLM55_03420 [Acidimicrobiales bacterium]
MSALCRYQLAGFLRSQRWVPPLLVYVLLLALVYADASGPAVPSYGVTAVALFPVAAWVTRTLLSTEDPIARQITAAAARGQLRVQAALLTSAVIAALPLVVLAVSWAALVNPTAVYGWRTWVGGLGIHLVFALAGTGLGALAGPPMLHRPGAAVLGIAMVTLLSIIIPASPVAWALRVLEHNPRHGFPAAITPSIAFLLGITAFAILASLATARRS